jgi:hypothetical protein
MVPDMRLRSIQRVRASGQQVVMKLKGEARTVAAEGTFIGTLRQDPVFEQVILEREAERQGGGWEFEMTLPVVSVPPPFNPEPLKPPPAATSVPAAPAAAPLAKASEKKPRPSAAPHAATSAARPAQAIHPPRTAEGVTGRPVPSKRRLPPMRQGKIRRDDGGFE